MALAASVISRMNHYLKSAPVARVKESELKGPRSRLALFPYPLPLRSKPTPAHARKEGLIEGPL